MNLTIFSQHSTHNCSQTHFLSELQNENLSINEVYSSSQRINDKNMQDINRNNITGNGSSFKHDMNNHACSSNDKAGNPVFEDSNFNQIINGLVPNSYNNGETCGETCGKTCGEICEETCGESCVLDFQVLSDPFSINCPGLFCTSGMSPIPSLSCQHHQSYIQNQCSQHQPPGCGNSNYLLNNENQLKKNGQQTDFQQLDSVTLDQKQLTANHSAAVPFCNRPGQHVITNTLATVDPALCTNFLTLPNIQGHRQQQQQPIIKRRMEQRKTSTKHSNDKAAKYQNLIDALGLKADDIKAHKSREGIKIGVKTPFLLDHAAERIISQDQHIKQLEEECDRLRQQNNNLMQLLNVGLANNNSRYKT